LPAADFLRQTFPGYHLTERQRRKIFQGVNAAEAETVRLIFERYLALGCVSKL
jgi:hypothetical protein